MSALLNASEIVEFAIQIEQNGYKFYIESMKKLNDTRITELFQFLADEEFRHERLFKDLLGKVGSAQAAHESYPGEYQSYMKEFLKTHALANETVLKKKIAGIKNLDDAVKMALEFEKDSIVLFTGLKNYVKEDVKEPVEKIVQEELTHILKINNFRNQFIKG